MLIDRFLEHWRLADNPFTAEEARHDPVFRRMLNGDCSCPDFEKILGTPARPSAAVVFGEKGSGKTALKLLLEQKLHRYNDEHPDRKVWVVRYDEMNDVLGRLARHGSVKGDQVMSRVRLADHLDAILSLAVTRLIDMVLGGENRAQRKQRRRTAQRMPRDRRIDLAHLALCYDQPTAGSVEQRWSKLRGMLRLGVAWMARPMRYAAALLGMLAGVLAIAVSVSGEPQMYEWLALIVAAAAALLFGLAAGWHWLSFHRLARRIQRAVRVVECSTAALRRRIEPMPTTDMSAQPIPAEGSNDTRYQLVGRLMGVLAEFGYVSMIVLIDRVDEPGAINGDPRRMQALVWPMLNNKFLQMDRVGIKLMLPIELRYLLYKESADFFQRARLDKQHMIDRLNWSGVTLYDLCNRRLAACMAPDIMPITLNDLFDDRVRPQDIIDALDQMQQPRDAFKFLYRLMQEHCAVTPEDQPVWRISRSTLEQVRREQARRLDDLHRGLGPA